MGLDMFLHRKKCISGYDTIPFEATDNCVMDVTIKTATRDGKPAIQRFLLNGKEARQTVITLRLGEVAYWRKANQIHKWFVDNIQCHEDDCGSYEVTSSDLRRLVDTCKKVLENHDLAAKLLPTSEGFFFGTTDYDECYFKDLQNTIDQIEAADPQDDDLFEYSSSW